MVYRPKRPLFPVPSPIVPVLADEARRDVSFAYPNDDSSVFMSDSLRDQLATVEVPEEANVKAAEQLEEKVIHVLLTLRDKSSPIQLDEELSFVVNGVLSGFLLGPQVKVDARVLVEDALKCVKGLHVVDMIELCHGLDETIEFKKTYDIKEIGISDVAPAGTCTLMLTLEPKE